MKKVILTAGALVCLGGLIGCQNNTYSEELEVKIQEYEHAERQAMRTQQALETEFYYIALSDIVVISNELNNDNSTYFEYGNNFNSRVIDEFDSNIQFIVKCSKIKSGETFKMTSLDMNNYIIYGEYEQLDINVEE